MTTVQTTYADPLNEHLRVAQPPSSLRVATPIAHAVNHVYAHLLGGVRVLQHCYATPTDDGDTLTYEIHRHPLCDYVDVELRLVSSGAQETAAWVVTVTAGTGDAVTATSGYLLTEAGTLRLRAPWHANDSGICTLTIEYADVAIRTIMVSDVPRSTIANAEGGVHLYDSTYTRVGLSGDRYIAASDEAGPEAMVAEIKAAWGAYRPQIYALALSEADKISISAGTWTDIVPPIRHKARRRKASTTEVDADWVIYAAVSGGATYELRISGGMGNFDLTGLTTAATTRRLISSVGIDATDYDVITPQARISAGTGTVDIYTVCGILEADAP